MAATIPPKPRAGHPLENRIPPPLVVLLLGAVMGGVAWVTPDVAVGTVPRYAVGGALVLLGLLVLTLGFGAFGRAKTAIDPVNIGRASALVTGGVFRYSRNPMYIGLAIMLVGWAVCLASPWALVGPVAFVVFTARFQIIPEERAMTTKFGREYADYQARVRRWL